MGDTTTTDKAAADCNVLFDDEVVKKLDCSKCLFAAHDMSYPHPCAELTARPLERGDYGKGYLSLLSQLTKVGDCSREAYEKQFDHMRAAHGCYYIIVVENTALNKVVASGSLVMEHKFTHNTALRGRIEDIVVDSGYRKLHLGLFLVELLTALSEVLRSYKTSLDCKQPLVGFYEKAGYKAEGQLFLTKRFYE